MKFWKRLFKSDYDRGRDTTDSSPVCKSKPSNRPACSPKPNLRAVSPQIEHQFEWKQPPTPVSHFSPQLAPRTRREGRPRRVYKGRNTPSTIFNEPICSTFSPGTLHPHIVFDALPKEIQKHIVFKSNIGVNHDE